MSQSTFEHVWTPRDDEANEVQSHLTLTQSEGASAPCHNGLAAEAAALGQAGRPLPSTDSVIRLLSRLVGSVSGCESPPITPNCGAHVAPSARRRCDGHLPSGHPNVKRARIEVKEKSIIDMHMSGTSILIIASARRGTSCVSRRSPASIALTDALCQSQGYVR
ncbi:hypothetical protein K466DRAFT_225877 [Polyporus arcularius HHB13444]|uniref:Uncharacterized protein n=1 Tax=Polyporus arcularius HHB13444 TaxID=1314778 RepID=A0A5C3P5A8_9APHY|nr:hypothetical protein K466DRAFT_225877 [Polyporus arcularius HHB13444]